MGEGKIDEVIKTTSSLLDSVGWGMQKIIKEGLCNNEMVFRGM
jgi:hypothetical protein